MRRPVPKNSNRTAQMRMYFAFYAAIALLVIPSIAHASPFDSGITQLQMLFTGTIARGASLIAIVLGGFGYAFGEPGAKKNLAGVAMGVGIAVMATNVLSWLWGV